MSAAAAVLVIGICQLMRLRNPYTCASHCTVLVAGACVRWRGQG